MTDGIGRRQVVQAMALGATMGATGVARAARPAVPMTVYKDANCGCCKAWVERVRAAGGLAVMVIDTPDLAAVKAGLGVPGALSACHTGVVAGYLVEGHVPPADIAKLLATRPAGVRGIAVPGMPAGSPGMEMPDGRRQAFDVLAFNGKGATRVFASYG